MPRRRWFSGYNVAAVATLAFVASAPGQTFVVSQLNEPLRDAFNIGELALNASYTVATVLASLPLVLVGALTDRLGPRRTLAIVALAFGGACMVMAGAAGFATVALAFFLLRFLGQGSMTMVSQHAVAMWFHRRLGAIGGVKQVIVFAVWIGFPQATLWLVETVGWRWTYVALGGLVWVTVIPCALLFLVDRPEQVGLEMDGARPSANAAPLPDPRPGAQEAAFTLKQAMRTRAYWLTAAAIFLAPLIGTAFLFDMQPILALRGMGKADAANAVSVWTATMAVMALPAGWFTDRLPARALIAVGTALIAASAAALWAAASPLAASGAMAIYGVGQALVASCAAAATARYFGRRHHGAIRSSIVRIGVLGTGLGPIVTAVSAEFTGGYGAAMLAFIAMCAPVAVLSLALRAPAPPR